VALLGPRQIGKTTLAKEIGFETNALYLDLESPADLVKLTDPVEFLSQHSNQLIILDEIQRSPDLFNALRGIIDQNRQRGKQGNQFLVLGSASMDLLRQSSETLAGRIYYLNMTGVNVLELHPPSPADIRALWLRGGFPESYLASSDALSMDWLEMLIRTYLERDVPQAGFRIPAARLRRLWTMLAHLQGESVNQSALGGNLEIDAKTVRTYMDTLVDLLLVTRLDPWYENVKKRLIKSPRYYVRDSGILHRLLGISNYESLISNPILSKSWEGFVIENIRSILPNIVDMYYFRTAAGAEIDLVIKFSSDEVWAIEIKHGTAPKLTSGFHQAAEDIGATHKFVVYSGADEIPIGHNTTVTSIVHLMKRIEMRFTV